jgi:predicted CoA-binding protein
MKKTVVIGASTNPSRYSFMAVNNLLDEGHEVVPVGIKDGEIRGLKILKGQPEIDDVHTVTLYVGPANQPQYYDYIISLKPERIIFNPGTENPELMKLAKSNNIASEVACTLVLLSINQY